MTRLLLLVALLALAVLAWVFLLDSDGQGASAGPGPGDRSPDTGFPEALEKVGRADEVQTPDASPAARVSLSGAGRWFVELSVFGATGREVSEPELLDEQGEVRGSWTALAPNRGYFERVWGNPSEEGGPPEDWEVRVEGFKRVPVGLARRAGLLSEANGSTRLELLPLEVYARHVTDPEGNPVEGMEVIPNVSVAPPDYRFDLARVTNAFGLAVVSEVWVAGSAGWKEGAYLPGRLAIPLSSIAQRIDEGVAYPAKLVEFSYVLPDGRSFCLAERERVPDNLNELKLRHELESAKIIDIEITAHAFASLGRTPCNRGTGLQLGYFVENLDAARTAKDRVRVEAGFYGFDAVGTAVELDWSDLRPQIEETQLVLEGMWPGSLQVVWNLPEAVAAMPTIEDRFLLHLDRVGEGELNRIESFVGGPGAEDLVVRGLPPGLYIPRLLNVRHYSPGFPLSSEPILIQSQQTTRLDVDPASQAWWVVEFPGLTEMTGYGMARYWFRQVHPDPARSVWQGSQLQVARYEQLENGLKLLVEPGYEYEFELQMPAQLAEGEGGAIEPREEGRVAVRSGLLNGGDARRTRLEFMEVDPSK